MKQLLLPTLLIFFLYLFNSCASKQQTTYSEVSPNPPSIEQMKIWIGSKKDGIKVSEAGIYSYEDCYEFNYADINNSDDIVELVETSGDDIFNKGVKYEHILCEEIKGFDYELGYIYLIKASRYFLGDESQSVSLDSVLSKEKDLHYIKFEEYDMLIGPKVGKAKGYHGEDVVCYQVYYETDENESQEWSSSCGYLGNFDYEEGYIYHVRIARAYASEYDRLYLMDSHSYSETVIKVISKVKVN